MATSFNRPSPAVRVVISPSLFESVTVHPTSPRFSLGMEEWTDSYLKSLEDQFSMQDTELSLNQQSSSSLGASVNSPHLPTYGPTSEHAPKGVLIQPHPQDLELLPNKCFQTLSSTELDKLLKPCIPKNMETSTKWALENFHSWLIHRNNGAKCNADICPETLLEDMDSTRLNKWFAAYVAETRKVNGDPYPPSTLQSLLSGLFQHMLPTSLTRVTLHLEISITQWIHSVDTCMQKV